MGETVLVEGPNGAGKTSLLRVCAGLIPLSSGRLSVLGLDPVRRRTAVRRRVGLLSHASHLYDDLTVEENVRFAVRASGGEVVRIAPACARWGLTGRLARTSASKLSAGQRRRVALAAQLVVLEAVLAVGVVLLYGARIEVPWLIVVSCLLGTVGLAATGTLYGALSAGIRVRETLLPLLLLPIVAPVLLAGTKIWQAAMSGGTPSDGTQWLRLLVIFDAVYVAVGVILFGPIQETA